jgi:ABC-type uncharacterized transport system permease subunit
VVLEGNILQEEKYFILNTCSLFIVFDALLQYYSSCKYDFQLMNVLLNSLCAIELRNYALFPEEFFLKCWQSFSLIFTLSLPKSTCSLPYSLYFCIP